MVTKYHFFVIFSQESEDRFIGQIDRNEIALSSGDQHKITVRNLVVPDLKDGMKIRYSLVARREQNKRRKKREEDPNNRKCPYLEPVNTMERL